jgi:hypothetical protein
VSKAFASWFSDDAVSVCKPGQMIALSDKLKALAWTMAFYPSLPGMAFLIGALKRSYWIICCAALFWLLMSVLRDRGELGILQDLPAGTELIYIPSKWGRFKRPKVVSEAERDKYLKELEKTTWAWARGSRFPKKTLK